MAIIKVETKNWSGIDKKPRVYFTCHPEDFDKYFSKICDDIFRTHDCAIYYTEDMTKVIAEEDRETDLGRNNLFVVPVTFKLLSTPNRAMDADIPYALQEHIPVLPFMMEPGIDTFYSKPDKFGELQYLNPFSSDKTEISYEEKLKKYLESVLISDELAKRVRAAFDAYIFLSYRKKDRRYANELMRLIHSIPECQDIAIWFDEFLTPGESFRESIDRILNDSKLFALLVTPNLLEEPDGKPNFVMAEEYPAAHKSGIPILPAEMEDTNRDALHKKFPDIPDSIKPDDAQFRSRLLEAITGLPTQSNNIPEHTYLIGLAYLEGIDMEVNRDRALKLITSAAEAGLSEAMRKLCRMYDEGIGVALDYRKAVVWAEKLADAMIARYGMEHILTLNALYSLAGFYHKSGNLNRAVGLQRKVYTLCCEVLGEKHPHTIAALSNLALFYGQLGDHRQELELNEKVYNIRCRVVGEEHPDTLGTLNNLAAVYRALGEYRKALELAEKVYILQCKLLGEEHPNTLTSLNNLAAIHSNLDDDCRAVELYKKAYALCCKVCGEEHPDTLNTLGNLALSCGKLGDRRRELELHEKVYNLRCKVVGEEHPETLATLNNLACAYNGLGEHRKALELQQKAYVLSCKVCGEEHPYTLTSLNNLAMIHLSMGDYRKAHELFQKAYTLRSKVLGEKHPKTLSSLGKLAMTNDQLGDYRRALELKERVYSILCEVQGEENQQTAESIINLALTYGYLDEYQKALELYEKAYIILCKVLGEEHPDTLTSLSILARGCNMVGDRHRELELRIKEYAIRCKVWGEEHPDTQDTFDTLLFIYDEMIEHRKKQELTIKTSALWYEIMDFDDVSIQADLKEIESTYDSVDDQIAMDLQRKMYARRCKVLGEKHPDTLISLTNLAYLYGKLGNYREAIEMQKMVCILCSTVLRKLHSVAMTSLRDLAMLYWDVADYENALEFLSIAYSLYSKTLGEEHPDTGQIYDAIVVLKWELEIDD